MESGGTAEVSCLPSAAAATTRIFVKGLPKHLTDARLREHFESAVGGVTDARIVRKRDGSQLSRCIGFVGFRTPDAAEAALRMFRGSYIDTSRIEVERALPPGDSALPSSNSRRGGRSAMPPPPPPRPAAASATAPAAAGSRKRKHDASSSAPPSAGPHSGGATTTADGSGSGSASSSGATTPSAASAGADAATSRLFLHNLPFDTAESDVHDLFARHGPVAEVHLPRDATTGAGTGLGFVRFCEPFAAAAARNALDGSIFQGRLLRVVPAREERSTAAGRGGGGGAGGAASAGSPPAAGGLGAAPSRAALRHAREAERVRQAASGEEQHTWNSLFLNQDSVMEYMSTKGLRKADIMQKDADGMAVSVSLAEIAVLQEIQAFLGEQGVSLDALGRHAIPNVERSNTVILVKNLPFRCTHAELVAAFSPFGEIARLVLPPARAIALVEFTLPADAKAAFRALSYTKFHHVPLYLEWAPDGVLAAATPAGTSAKSPTPATAAGGVDSRGDGNRTRRAAASATAAAEPNEKLIVRNLPFEASKRDIRQLFSVFGQVKSVRIPKKPDGTSRGFAFVEMFTRQEAANCLEALRHVHLYGRHLVMEYASTADETSLSSAREKAARLAARA